MKTRLSVIIPGYNNRFSRWERCVRSVLQAISNEDEIICVDDGSLNQNELKNLTGGGIWGDERIRWIWREHNEGLASARNVAMTIAKGSYITFVDSDDEVRRDTYKKTILAMEQTESDIGVFGVNVIWVDEKLQKHDMPNDEYIGKLKPEDVKTLSQRCLFNYACNKVYKVDFISEHGADWNDFRFDLKGMPCEDLIFNLNFVMSGARWCTVAYEGYIYYRTNSTLLSRYKATNRDGALKAAAAWKKYLSFSQSEDGYFVSKSVVTELQLEESDWDNAWRPGSPISLLSRWRLRPGIDFVKKAIYTIIRRYCFIRPIRRYHIKRMFPRAESI